MNLLQGSIPENTKNATKTWIKHLNAYIKKVNGGLDITIDDIGTDELPPLLYEFYFDGQYKSFNSDRSEECEQYKNTSLKSIRAAITRYLKNTRGIDIINDVRFTKSNEMFKAVTKTNK